MWPILAGTSWDVPSCGDISGHVRRGICVVWAKLGTTRTVVGTSKVWAQLRTTKTVVGIDKMDG